jgi:hypothetical protein
MLAAGALRSSCRALPVSTDCWPERVARGDRRALCGAGRGDTFGAVDSFLAGVGRLQLSPELEADIEIPRLLALFHGRRNEHRCGMRSSLLLIVLAALIITALKAGIVWALFRATCMRGDALRAGSILTAAGEFAFVLIPLGGSLGMLDQRQAGILVAIAAVSMLFGPPTATLADALLRRFARPAEREPDDFSDARGSVLLIGWGRFGQIVSQCLLAEGIDVDHRQRPRNDPRAGASASGVARGSTSRRGGARRELSRFAQSRRPSSMSWTEFPGSELCAVRSPAFSAAIAGVLRVIRVRRLRPQRWKRGIGFRPSKLVPRSAHAAGGGISAGLDIYASMLQEPLSKPEGEAKPLNPEAREIVGRRPVAE